MQRGARRPAGQGTNERKMKREIKTNAAGIKKIISHYGSQLENMPISIFHQGVILRRAPEGVEVMFRNSNDVWKRSLSFLNDKEYFPGAFTIVVQDDYTTRWGLADQIKSIIA